MILTKQELIASLQHEVHILLHLASKIDPKTMLDYRPGPKQRSTIELLRYLTLMGPFFTRSAIAGKGFNADDWTQQSKAADARDFDQTIAAIASQKDAYASLIGGMSDADFRGEIEMWGNKYTRGSFIVNLVLAGHAAYRTQLFLYLKACGREELGTMNLWAGVDAAATV
jgi:hypothetical protein